MLPAYRSEKSEQQTYLSSITQHDASTTSLRQPFDKSEPQSYTRTQVLTHLHAKWHWHGWPAQNASAPAAHSNMVLLLLLKACNCCVGGCNLSNGQTCDIQQLEHSKHTIQRRQAAVMLWWLCWCCRGRCCDCRCCSSGCGCGWCSCYCIGCSHYVVVVGADNSNVSTNDTAYSWHIVVSCCGDRSQSASWALGYWFKLWVVKQLNRWHVRCCVCLVCAAYGVADHDLSDGKTGDATPAERHQLKPVIIQSGTICKQHALHTNHLTCHRFNNLINQCKQQAHTQTCMYVRTFTCIYTNGHMPTPTPTAQPRVVLTATVFNIMKPKTCHWSITSPF